MSRTLNTGLTNAQIAQNGISFLPLDSTASTSSMSASGSSPININNQVADNNLGYRLNQASLLQPALVNQLELGSNAANLQYGQAEKLSGTADTLRGDYSSTWRPIAQQFASEASSYGNSADQAAAAAKAGETTDAALADARSSSARQMASMGINPNSGRFAGLQESADVEGAAKKAAIMTSAAQDVKDKGIALRGQAVTQGNQTLSQANSTANLASTIGASAADTAGTGVSNALNTTSMVGQGFNAQQNAQSTAQGASDNAASRALAQERYNQEQSSADDANWLAAASTIGSIAGALWG
ncbi:hypothetical protein [Uliginosibacterium sp. 31-12]|uniref:hypothetical protein n=1 Tax=Uliginosibacterium sp. 31-12 TaxID=3062781 RepID=UPI0026E2EACA|nr:hypothetical protein [Uliginosibacterium sp. 31-12]MDO6385573.1 hypothetical protein [Uliginosibacterium sp. 31-12]